MSKCVRNDKLITSITLMYWCFMYFNLMYFMLIHSNQCPMSLLNNNIIQIIDSFLQILLKSLLIQLWKYSSSFHVKLFYKLVHFIQHFKVYKFDHSNWKLKNKLSDCITKLFSKFVTDISYTVNYYGIIIHTKQHWTSWRIFFNLIRLVFRIHLC